MNEFSALTLENAKYFIHKIILCFLKECFNVGLWLIMKFFSKHQVDDDVKAKI